MSHNQEKNIAEHQMGAHKYLEGIHDEHRHFPSFDFYPEYEEKKDWKY